ncbi:MAG TPA: hypothetical protein VE130_04560 [Nitrososphaeraceae archaeon]|nr:hypothetical protein [Nitrososphaeraceae archaeon]
MNIAGKWVQLILRYFGSQLSVSLVSILLNQSKPNAKVVGTIGAAEQLEGHEYDDLMIESKVHQEIFDLIMEEWNVIPKHLNNLARKGYCCCIIHNCSRLLCAS